MNLPIAERFPGTATLPLAGIATLPTPLEPFEVGVSARSLKIKRDDLSSAVYGGNKVRKLDFLLGQAIAEGRRAVLTFGAYGSNHALATAVHARALGLEPHVVLSPQAPGPFARATLLAHAGLGTVVHPVEGWDGAEEAARVSGELADRDGVAPFEIPMGGTSGLGAVGYVNAAFELAAEAPDRVYVPGGTLGTAVGLAVGFAVVNPGTRVVAVRVTPEGVGSEDVAREVTQECIRILRSVDPSFPHMTLDDLNLILRHDWFEPGYGVVTPETLAAVVEADAAGVKLETTYTGKAFAAMTADAGAGELRDLDVVFWDTYNSAPMPAPGPVDVLPKVLRDYVAECERAFG